MNIRSRSRNSASVVPRACARAGEVADRDAANGWLAAQRAGRAARPVSRTVDDRVEASIHDSSHALHRDPIIVPGGNGAVGAVVHIWPAASAWFAACSALACRFTTNGATWHARSRSGVRGRGGRGWQGVAGGARRPAGQSG